MRQANASLILSAARRKFIVANKRVAHIILALIVSPFAILALIVAHSLFWLLTSLRKQCKMFALVAAQSTPKFVISWLRARIGHKPINLG
jgi:hypothetical protein